MAKQVVARVDRSRFDDVVEVLAHSFYDYPVMRYVLQDAGDAYDGRLRKLVGYFTKLRFERDYPVLGIASPDGARLLAVANINPPRTVPSSVALERLFENLRQEIGDAAIERFLSFARACDPLEPEEPHYALGMIGVAPEAQGHGLARVLLEKLHTMSAEDTDSTGVCLTTETPHNVTLYEHFGYSVLGRVETPDGELESWTMFRENGPGQVARE